MKISEVFFSIQGEGPAIGQPAVFVRLANCNLKCVWCDTRYSWDWKEYDRSKESIERTPAEVAAWVRSLLPKRDLEAPQPRPLVIFTGGEPLLQPGGIELVMADLSATLGFYDADIETSGSLPLPGALALRLRNVVVSPKLKNSKNLATARLRPEILRDLVSLPKAVFKFVIDTPGDVFEVEDYEEALGIRDPGRIWLMPQGMNPAEVAEKARWVAEEAKKRGWRYTPRLHLDLWGVARGT